MPSTPDINCAADVLRGMHGMAYGACELGKTGPALQNLGHWESAYLNIHN